MAWVTRVSGGISDHLLGGSLGGGGFRVLDAGTEKADESLADRLSSLMDVVHVQLALVELPVLDLPPYRVCDDVLYALGCRLREGLDGRLDRVGEHHDPRLL